MLSADDFKILESLATDNGCVKSNVIRQGISYYKFFNDALKNGSTSAGTALLSINTPASAGASDLIIPDMGILFDDGVFIDVNDVNVTSVTLLFYGGAAQ